jgi:hypothetical protein
MAGPVVERHRSFLLPVPLARCRTAEEKQTHKATSRPISLNGLNFLRTFWLLDALHA